MEMKEVLKQSVNFWQSYWGDSLMPWLLLAAVFFLVIFRRKKKSTKYLLFYLFLVLALFFCPSAARIIQKCIGSSVYWRVLWLLPVVPVIAVAMTEFLKERKGILQFLLVIAAAGAVAVCGKGICQAGNYKLVHNYQHVPDEVAAICEMVKQDAKDSEFLLAADNYIGPYVRVYDPSIYMLFNREGRGGAGEGVRQLYLEINAPVFNYSNIASAGKRLFCNYLVVKIPDKQQKSELELYGYQEVGTAGSYALYRLGDSADAVRNPILDRWDWR